MEIKYEVDTNKSFEEAVESLKTSLSNNSFGVLWELNFKDKLKEKGFDFDHNFKIFEVCNPRQAKEVLDRHIEVGYFLPCKIVIYDKGNTVKIGMVKPTQLINMLGDQELTSVATEVENELKTAINMAAN
ncbi:DUF302 domain-containing protein [Sporosalibacterium faouarense]|uniref:DUF302 domain-containing protein n=1 Tax=Sporosalibacterium faouarense TaxID=516123 RepID=UPI00192C8F99|nr:DUF302 domain-containing protein [Sporosalibacterium faouarense]